MGSSRLDDEASTSGINVSLIRTKSLSSTSSRDEIGPAGFMYVPITLNCVSISPYEVIDSIRGTWGYKRSGILYCLPHGLWSLPPSNLTYRPAFYELQSQHKQVPRSPLFFHS